MFNKQVINFDKDNEIIPVNKESKELKCIANLINDKLTIQLSVKQTINIK